MNHCGEFTVDLNRNDIQALAAAAGLTIEELLQATAALAHHQEQQPPGSSLYQRIGYASGLLWLVNTLYQRMLADPLLMSYFRQLDDQHRQRLRWHMLTLLAVVTGGPSKYQGRDLHEVHADLHITEEAFDRLLWHVQGTLQTLRFPREDEKAILAEVRARRAAVVTSKSLPGPLGYLGRASSDPRGVRLPLPPLQGQPANKAGRR